MKYNVMNILGKSNMPGMFKNLKFMDISQSGINNQMNKPLITKPLSTNTPSGTSGTNPFSTKPPTNSNTPSRTSGTNPFSTKPPTNSNTPSGTSGTNPFSTKPPTNSNTPSGTSGTGPFSTNSMTSKTSSNFAAA
jgi:hypothetical protein